MTIPLQDAEPLAPAASKVLAASIALNLLLMAMQAAAGTAAHSSGMLADAAHSFVDLMADALVLLACRLDARPQSVQSARHGPRYEPLALLGLGLLLGATGVQMGWQAIERFGNPSDCRIGLTTLAVAVFTLASKEALFRWMAHAARRTRSALLLANAWHVRSDALASLLVMAAVVGSLAGLTQLDDVAAALIGLMIARAGAGFAWRGWLATRARRAGQRAVRASQTSQPAAAPAQVAMAGNRSRL